MPDNLSDTGEEEDYDTIMDAAPESPVSSDAEDTKENSQSTDSPKTPTEAGPEEEDKGLPDYIPKYFPPFPTTSKDDEIAPQLPRQLPVASAPVTALSAPTTNSNASAPIIVKNRRKPVNNPFTHVVPFEDSTLATDKTNSLSLTLTEDAETRPTSVNKRRKLSTMSIPMKNALEAVSKKGDHDQVKKKPTTAFSGNYAMFRKFTQDDAAPGNTMFGNSTGMLGELLRHVAPPAMVSKLSAPNLLVDVASTYTSNQPTNTASATAETNGNAATSAKDTGVSQSTSGSMLASLAGGQYSKKSHQAASVSSAASSTIPARVTAAPPTHTAATTATTNMNSQYNIPTSTPASTSSSIESGPGRNSKPALTPISLASLSASPDYDAKKKKKLPKLTLNLNNNEATATQSPSHSADYVSSPVSALNTPKIRFKIKAPEPSERPPENQSIPSGPAVAARSSNDNDGGEVIHCICDNPTIDYGTFMIACDQCGVWFHGNCVGIAESDNIEEWFCSRCRPRRQ